jgi:NAD(P)H-quinone oxidoreductase subunit 5
MTSNLFNFDPLALAATALIIFISSVVALYAKKYLRTDKRRKNLLLMISLITTSLIITFSADNIFLICASWMTSNFLLVLMMIHKNSWRQAVQSGRVALKNFAIGSLCLAFALIILCFETKSCSIKEILNSEDLSKNSLIFSTILIAIAALTQSAIYPFHSWLISSLNSPTPVSAIMHAGLVNGGGILLTRFAPLFLKTPDIMTIIFALGIFSAIIGTLWKLIQSNVKSMLACSTMSQMGFMIAQCGMGLFPAAIAHLFWHGMFKSYLFLSSPSSWNEKRFDLEYPPKASSFLASLICGFFGALIFAKINEIEIQKLETTIVLVAVAFIAASQVALTIIGKLSAKSLVSAVVLSSFLSATYASSVVLIEKIMPAEIFQPQQLNIWHIAAIILLTSMWLARMFLKSRSQKMDQIFLRGYVKILNASQPELKTITSNRNQYNYR